PCRTDLPEPVEPYHVSNGFTKSTDLRSRLFPELIRPPPLLAILAAHPLHAPIVRMVRGNRWWQPFHGGQRLIRARVGSVGDTVMLLAGDLHAVHEKLVDRQDLGCSKQEVFQLP